MARPKLVVFDLGMFTRDFTDPHLIFLLNPLIVHCSVICSSYFQNRVCFVRKLYPIKICHVQLRATLSDYTLWPFWIDTHYDAPFTKRRYMYNLYKTSLHFQWIVFDFYMYTTFDFNLLLNKLDNSSKTDVKDVHGRQVPFYTDVPRILQNLNNDGIKVGVASRYVLNWLL